MKFTKTLAVVGLSVAWLWLGSLTSQRQQVMYQRFRTWIIPNAAAETLAKLCNRTIFFFRRKNFIYLLV